MIVCSKNVNFLYNVFVYLFIPYLSSLMTLSASKHVDSFLTRSSKDMFKDVTTDLNTLRGNEAW